MGAGNSAVVVDLPRCGPMLSPRAPNLVPIPGPRMERETPGQRPRPNYGHPQANAEGLLPPHTTTEPERTEKVEGTTGTPWTSCWTELPTSQRTNDL